MEGCERAGIVAYNDKKVLKMRIAKKLKRQGIPIIVFIGLIVFLLCLPQWSPSIDDDSQTWSNIWLGVIGGAATIYLGLLKQWMDHDKMFKELFLEFNQRFDDLNESLNAIVERKELPKGKSKQAVIQDYINLCSEEYLWHKTGRIDKEVWDAWKKGIEYYYSKSEDIRKRFDMEKKESDSYYGLFDVLNLEEPETNTPEEKSKQVRPMEKAIKIILALMLFACLLDMPYGYYQLVRFTAMGVFGYLAFISFERQERTASYVYMLLALLFQPFFKVALGRELWNVVDVVVGVGLIVTMFMNAKQREN
jgi:hypothetical protein